jgi:hypothetical protein
MWMTDAPFVRSGAAYRKPRDLLAVRRRHAMDGRGHQSVTQLGRDAASTVDEHGAGTRVGIHPDDRAGVRRCHGRHRESDEESGAHTIAV